MEQKQAEEEIANLSDQNRGSPDSLEKFVELAGTALLSYEMGNPEEKRQIVKIVTSNRRATGKNVELEPSNPFRAIKNRSSLPSCDRQQDIPRTLDALLDNLSKLNQRGELPDVDSVFSSQDKDIKGPNPKKTFDFAANHKGVPF